MELLGPVDLIISCWECQGFSTTGFRKGLEWHKIQSLHQHGMINHLGSIHFSFAWLCNWEHPFSAWLEGESLGALHVNQALPWRTTPTRCNTMRFLCALATQLVDQPCTTLNFTVDFEIHHKKPQLFLTYWIIKTIASQLQGKRNLLGFLRTQ
jgi:hypothetical protein